MKIVPTIFVGKDAAGEDPVQASKIDELRIVILLVGMPVLPGFATAAVETSHWADARTIIVKTRQSGCEHIGVDEIAAGLSVDLTHALGDSRSVSARLDESTLFPPGQNESKVLVWLRCLPGEKAKLEASVRHATDGESFETIAVDGTIDELLTLRKELEKTLYQLLSVMEEPHPNKVSGASAYREYLLAIGSDANGNHATRLNALEKAIRSSDTFGPLWTQLGATQLRLGEKDFRNASDHFSGAENSLGKALAINPTYPLAIDTLASVYMRTGRTEEAVHLVRQGIVARPSSAALRSRLGYAYRYAGLLDESVIEYRRSAALDPGLANVISVEGQIAKALIYQGRYADALRSYDRIRSLLAEYDRSPDEKTLFYEGLTYFYAGQRPKAVQLFDAAYAAEPDSLWSRFAIAYKYAALDNHEDLVSIAGRLETDDIADGERRYRLAHFYAMAGHQTEAASQLAAALEAGNFNYRYISRDPFLEAVRPTKQYGETMRRMKQRQTAFQDKLNEINGGHSQ